MCSTSGKDLMAVFTDVDWLTAFSLLFAGWLTVFSLLLTGCVFSLLFTAVDWLVVFSLLLTGCVFSQLLTDSVFLLLLTGWLITFLLRLTD